MEELSHLGEDPKKDEHYPTIWEELKYRMQEAFQVLTGQSAVVDFQQLQRLEYGYSFYK